jgi:hypothetical protein
VDRKVATQEATRFCASNVKGGFGLTCEGVSPGVSLLPLSLPWQD